MKYTKKKRPYMLNEYPCGCWIYRDGAGAHFIEYCPLHKSAPLLYEAIDLALNDLSERGRITSTTERILWDAKAKADGK